MQAAINSWNLEDVESAFHSSCKRIVESGNGWTIWNYVCEVKKVIVHYFVRLETRNNHCAAFFCKSKHLMNAQRIMNLIWTKVGTICKTEKIAVQSNLKFVQICFAVKIIQFFFSISLSRIDRNKITAYETILQNKLTNLLRIIKFMMQLTFEMRMMPWPLLFFPSRDMVFVLISIIAGQRK